jgi:RNA polymerase sigma-70 factor (ECF subfamily)
MAHAVVWRDGEGFISGGFMWRLLSVGLLIPVFVLVSGMRPEDAKSDDAVSLANAPPVVVKTVPESGKDGVDSSITDIKVTYSKDMMDHTWSWSTWGEGTFPQTTGKPHYQVDNRTCVLPVKLKPDKTYAIWLNSDNFHNFKDSKGNAAVPYLLIFKTKAAPEPSRTSRDGL